MNAMNELTTEELSDLADLCDREADAFDYDEEVCARFTALHEKLSKMIEDKLTGGHHVQD